MKILINKYDHFFIYNDNSNIFLLYMDNNYGYFLNNILFNDDNYYVN